MGKAHKEEKQTLTTEIRRLNPERDAEELAEKTSRLDTLLAIDLDRLKLLSGEKYIEEDEKCTAFFFACTKQRKAQAHFSAARDIR